MSRRGTQKWLNRDDSLNHQSPATWRLFIYQSQTPIYACPAAILRRMPNSLLDRPVAAPFFCVLLNGHCFHPTCIVRLFP